MDLDFEVTVLSYGHPQSVDGYTNVEYRNLLDECLIAVFLSSSESQGIALAEAWSMDVPTLVFQGTNTTIDGQIEFHSDAAPYLSDATGLKFAEVGELESLRSIMQFKSDVWQPRKWVEEHMSDSQVATLAMRLFEETMAQCDSSV